MSSSTSTLAYDIIARDRASSTFSKIGRAAGALGVGLGTIQLANFVKDSVLAEATFSQTMASVQVNANLGSRALGQMSDLALKFGQDTVYSANEAAQAMLELSKGGMTAAQIKAGALKSTLNLAATEGIALGDSATIVARTLKTFGLNAGDANKAVDMLAGGSLASTAGVQDLADALKYVGTTAQTSGYGLSDTVTALAALTDSGISSTTAGTALNRMLLGLTLGTTKASQTAKELGLSFTDAKGNLLPMVDVVKRLQDAFHGMSTSQRNNDLKKIFGVEGMRAANVLIEQGVKGWEKYKGAVDQTGQAAKMADARMSGTKGALEQLSGSIETAQIKLGKALAPAVQDVATALADNLGPAMDEAIGLAQDVGAAVEPFAKILFDVGKGAANVAGFLTDLPDPLKSIAIEAGIAAFILPRLAAGVGSVTSAMQNGYTYARVYALELTDTATRSQAASMAMSKMGGAAKQAAGVGGMLAIAAGAQQSNKAVGTLLTTLGGAATGFSVGGPWGALIGGAAGAAMGLFSSSTKQAASTAVAAAPDIDSLADSFSGLTAKVTEATRAEILHDLREKGLISSMNAYGVSTRTLIDATLGHADAQREVSRALEKANKNVDKSAEAMAAEGVSVSQVKDQLKSTKQTWDEYTGAVNKARQQHVADAKATAAMRDLYKSLPKEIQTKITPKDIPSTMADVRSLIKQYDLTPKQVQTVASVSGIDLTLAQIKHVQAAMSALDGKRADVTVAYHYTGLQAPGGPGPTRGHGDDNMPSGVSPRAGAGGDSGPAGRFTTSSGRRSMSRGGLDGAEIRVVGMDPGQRAFFYTGGTSRYS